MIGFAPRHFGVSPTLNPKPRSQGWEFRVSSFFSASCAFNFWNPEGLLRV